MTETQAPPAAARPLRARLRPGRGLLAVADQAVVSGTSFATSVLLARAWAPDEFGGFSLALGLTFIARAVLAELVSAPFTVYCGRYRGDDLAGYTGSTLVHHLLLTVVTVAVLSAAAGALWMTGGSASAVAAVAAAAAATPFLLVREYVRRIDLAQFEAAAVFATDAGVAVCQIGGLLLLREAGLLTVGGAFAVIGAAAAVACAAWVVIRRRTVRVVTARLLPDWRRNWTFARWSVVGCLVGIATPFVLPWVIAAAVGEAATGTFVACVTLVNVAGTYIAGVTNYLMPRAARGYATGGVAELRRVLGGVAVLFGLTLGAFCAAVVLAGDRPATLVYGPAYAGCGAVLAVLAVQVWVTSIGITAGNGLWAMDRPRANAAADAGTIAVTVAAVLALLPPYGLVGAAVGALLGTTAGASLRVATLLRLMARDGEGAHRE